MRNSTTRTVITLPFRTEKGELVDRAQFTLAEASRLAGPPVSQFRQLARDGVFNPVVGFGRKWYITAEDLLRLFNKRLRNANPDRISDDTSGDRKLVEVAA